MFTEEVSERLKEICIGMGIEENYEVRFVDIGMEEDHVHFFVQGVPKLVVNQIVMIIKSIPMKRSFPRIRREILWGVVDKRGILQENIREPVGT